MAENKDRRMNELIQAADAEFIYAESADGSQVKIKKSDLIELLSTSFKSITLGDVHDTDGSVSIYSRSSIPGAFTCIGNEHSSGCCYISYGVRVKSDTRNTWISSCAATIPRSVFVFRFDGSIKIGTAQERYYNVGEEVQLTWKIITPN